MLGSPRAANAPLRPSPVHVPEDIGVGSLVEVATDVDQHYYGVVRWIGVIDGMNFVFIITSLDPLILGLII